VVVPDGALHLVNLSTLSSGEGGYLIETAPPVSYLSAERDLLRHGGGDTRGEGLLVVGGPDFDYREPDSGIAAPTPQTATPQTEGCEDFGSSRFSKLTGALREAELITSLWREAAAEDETPRVTTLLGEHATEKTVKQQAPGHSVIHLATHGFFIDDPCETGKTHTPVEDLAPALKDDPPVLSGLALASANLRQASSDGSEDGILTSQEISALDLTEVEWVVLSACETGTGQIRTGEGVFGLRRSFEIAGSDSLIMSLWAVDDAWTREWMRGLYEGRLAGMSTVKAVRSAALEVLRSRRDEGHSGHPFYWGAFISSGNWR